MLKVRKLGERRMYFLVDYYCQSIEDSSTNYKTLEDIKEEFEQATGLFIFQIAEAPDRETMLEAMAIAAGEDDED
jgi:hypothetical protein